jgi:hypothetical protein
MKIIRNYEKMPLINPNPKELKDYTDQELINEITQRIDNFSLDNTWLAILMIKIGAKYLDYYRKEREKQQKETN